MMIFKIFEVNGEDRNVNITDIIRAFAVGTGSMILLNRKESFIVADSLEMVAELSSDFVLLTDAETRATQKQGRKVLYNTKYIREVVERGTGSSVEYLNNRYLVLENKNTIVSSVTGSGGSGLTDAEKANFDALIAEGVITPVNESFTGTTSILVPQTFDTDHVKRVESLQVSWNGSAVPHADSTDDGEYEWILDSVAKTITVRTSADGQALLGVTDEDLFLIEGFVNVPL